MPTFHAAPPRKRLKPLPPDLRPRRYAFEFNLHELRFATFTRDVPSFEHEWQRLMNCLNLFPPTLLDIRDIRSLLSSPKIKDRFPDFRWFHESNEGGSFETITVTFTKQPAIGKKLRAALKLP